MNKYSISDDKLDIFLFISSEIIKIRDSIRIYPSVAGDTSRKFVIDYKSSPESCVKIRLLIDYILDNITKNKTSITRSIGSIFELYTTWKMLCDKTEQYRKHYLSLAKNNLYINSILKQFDDSNIKTKNFPTFSVSYKDGAHLLPLKAPGIALTSDLTDPDSKHNFPSKNQINANTYFVEICEKYIENKIEQKSILDILKQISEKLKTNVQLSNDDIKLFLLEIGEKFPLYILEQIFNKSISRQLIKTFYQELNIKPFWSKEKQRKHGEFLGKLTTTRIKKISIQNIIGTNIIKKLKLTTKYKLKDIVELTIANKTNIIKIDKFEKDIEDWIREVYKKETLSFDEVCKYIFIMYGFITDNELNLLVGTTTRILNIIVAILELPKHSNKSHKLSNSDSTKQKEQITEIVKINDNPSNVGLSPGYLSLTENNMSMTILSSGDLQLVIKRGTNDYEKCLKLFNEKLKK